MNLLSGTVSEILEALEHDRLHGSPEYAGEELRKPIVTVSGATFYLEPDAPASAPVPGFVLPELTD